MAKTTRVHPELTPPPKERRGKPRREPVITDNGPAPPPAPPPPPPPVDRPSRVSDWLPPHVRAKLEAAFAEERLEDELFRPFEEKQTMTFNLTLKARTDLEFLADWFQGRYARHGKANRSALVRLAIRCLRLELDPGELAAHPALPGLDGPGKDHPATHNGEG